MALLGATIGVDKTALIDLAGDTATVDRYAHSDDDNITKACNAQTDAFRSAAIKGGYSSTSVDALTSATTPDSVKRWILKGVLDDLTSGGMARPDIIGENGVLWRQWLSRLAGGAETIDGLTRTTTTGGTQIRIAGPTANVFDRDNTASTGVANRDPRL